MTQIKLIDADNNSSLIGVNQPDQRHQRAIPMVFTPICGCPGCCIYALPVSVSFQYNTLIMPTTLRIGPYRFFFYSSDSLEPPHVHVRRERYTAKFWLSPVRLQHSKGFPRQEIGWLQQLIEQHQKRLIEEWYEYFNG